MGRLFEVDWRELFVPQMSLAEMLVRGVCIYFAVCILMRVVLKRQTGKVGLGDLLVVTLVTGICRNPLVADKYSIPDGVGVIGVVLICSYLLDWLAFRFHCVQMLVHPPAVLLVRNGEVIHANLRNELLTEKRLEGQLRSHGVTDLSEVAEAWMESNGEVSVVKHAPGASCRPDFSHGLAEDPDPAELRACLQRQREHLQEAQAEIDEVLRTLPRTAARPADRGGLARRASPE